MAIYNMTSAERKAWKNRLKKGISTLGDTVSNAVIAGVKGGVKAHNFANDVIQNVYQNNLKPLYNSVKKQYANSANTFSDIGYDVVKGLETINDVRIRTAGKVGGIFNKDIENYANKIANYDWTKNHLGNNGLLNNKEYWNKILKMYSIK